MTVPYSDMEPKRIQRKRTRGWRMPENAVGMPNVVHLRHAHVMEPGPLGSAPLSYLWWVGGHEAAPRMRRATSSPSVPSQGRSQRCLSSRAPSSRPGRRHGLPSRPGRYGGQGGATAGEARGIPAGAVRTSRGAFVSPLRDGRRSGAAIRPYRWRWLVASSGAAIRKRVLPVSGHAVRQRVAATHPSALRELQHHQADRAGGMAARPCP